MNTEHEVALTNEYVAWLNTHNLPHVSAEELIAELHAVGNHSHDEWINDFTHRWEVMMNAN